MLTLQATLSIELVRALVAEFLHLFDLSCLHRTCKQFRTYFQKQIDEMNEILDKDRILSVTGVIELAYEYEYNRKVIFDNYGSLPGNIQFKLTENNLIVTSPRKFIKKKHIKQIERFFPELKINFESAKLIEETINIYQNYNMSLGDILLKEVDKWDEWQYVYKGVTMIVSGSISLVSKKCEHKSTYMIYVDDGCKFTTIIIKQNDNRLDMRQILEDWFKKHKKPYNYRVIPI